MITDFPTAPLAPGLRGAGGSTVEKSLSASHTEILTLPRRRMVLFFMLALCSYAYIFSVAMTRHPAAWLAVDS